MLHEHCGKQNDENVDRVVQDEDGRQQLSRSLPICWSFEQVEDGPRPVIFRFGKGAPFAGPEGEKRNFTSGDEGTHHEQKKRRDAGNPSHTVG